MVADEERHVFVFVFVFVNDKRDIKRDIKTKTNEMSSIGFLTLWSRTLYKGFKKVNQTCLLKHLFRL